MPSNTETESTGPETFIGFLMQADMAQGAVSSEIGDYQRILDEYRKHAITADQAIEKAKGISSGRQENYH